MSGTFRVRVDSEWHYVPKHRDELYGGAQCDSCGQSDGLRIDCYGLDDGWSLVCDECGDRFEARG